MSRRGGTPAAAERRALEVHDDLVQGLTAIHWALVAGAYEQARAAARSTLAQAQAMIGGLVAERSEPEALGPGALRRADPTR